MASSKSSPEPTAAALGPTEGSPLPLPSAASRRRRSLPPCANQSKMGVRGPSQVSCLAGRKCSLAAATDDHLPRTTKLPRALALTSKDHRLHKARSLGREADGETLPVATSNHPTHSRSAGRSKRSTCAAIPGTFADALSTRISPAAGPEHVISHPNKTRKNACKRVLHVETIRGRAQYLAFTTSGFRR